VIASTVEIGISVMQPEGHSASARVLDTSEADELRALYLLTDRLYRATSLEDVYEAALDAITDTLGCRRASILLFDDRGIMQFVAWRGLSDAYRRTLAGHSPWKPGDRDPAPLLVSDILDTAEPEWIKSTIADEGIRGLSFVPIVAQGAVIGKFMTYYPAPHAFSRHEVDLATLIARQVGFSVERARAESRRERAEEELRDSEERLRLLSDLAPVMIWMGDAAGDCVELNRALREFWGLSDDPTGWNGFDWRETVHPDDRAGMEDALDAAMRDRAPLWFRARFRSIRGAYRVLETKARPRLSARGEFLGMIGVNLDVTEHEEAAAQRELLLAEMSHRVKNTLAVVQAIARQTFKRTGTMEAGRAFEGRLSALAATHDLLTRDSWDSAPLTRLAADALRADDARMARVTLSGPEVLLPPKQAVSLTLALHELFTNALKYGALSNDGGRVALTWQADGGALRLAWTEMGGPPVAPPEHRGFGSVLIERALARDCDATVRLEYPQDGLTCSIEMPLPPAGR
jgi:PAS domain S-box-containing protein